MRLDFRWAGMELRLPAGAETLAVQVGEVKIQSGARIPGAGHPRPVTARVERFDRRGTEPFELFEPFEFFQNRNFPEIFLENSKISENFNIF